MHEWKYDCCVYPVGDSPQLGRALLFEGGTLGYVELSSYVNGIKDNGLLFISPPIP